MRLFRIVVGVLAAVGALNWGLIGLFRFNLVRRLLGGSRGAERTIYTLVGLSGASLLLMLSRLARRY
jgi:uncharacterized protein